MTTEVIKRFESEEDFSRIYMLYWFGKYSEKARDRDRERNCVCVCAIIRQYYFKMLSFDTLSTPVRKSIHFINSFSVCMYESERKKEDRV